MHKYLFFLRSIKHHKRRSFFILIAIIVAAIIFWPRPQKPVETQIVKKANITESISTSGSIHALKSVDLNFLTSGKVAYLGVKKGDKVSAGQTIATLDQRTVQKNLEDKLRDYSIQRNTFDETLEDNQNRTPEQALNNDMRRILQNNQFDLEKAVISVELQDLAKQQAVLSSPISGIVTRADITSTGINAAITNTFTVAEPENLVFKIDIDEADIGKVKLNQQAKITLDAYPDEPINLIIHSMDFAAHTTSVGGNAYTVEANLPLNKNLKYRIGMSGDAEIIIAKKTNTQVVSLASITDDNAVYVKTGDGFEKRKVTTGIQSDTEIEIIKGLSTDEVVALQPDIAATQAKNPKKRFFFF